MSESVVEMGCKDVVTRVPDHSLLHRQVLVDTVKRKRRKLRVSEGYLHNDVENLAKFGIE